MSNKYSATNIACEGTARILEKTINDPSGYMSVVGIGVGSSMNDSSSIFPSSLHFPSYHGVACYRVYESTMWK